MLRVEPVVFVEGSPNVGTIAAFVGIAIAVAAAMLGAWAAFRSAWPRRILYIELESAVSLLRTTPGLDSGIEVLHDGRQLTEPYVVAVGVTSRSDRDIDSASFDGKPLELELGVPIVKLLESTADARRAAVRTTPVVVTSTALHVGPALLTRRHLLRYVVLVDGQPDFRPIGDLVNVAIREGSVPDRRRLAALIPAVLITAGATLLTNSSPGASDPIGAVGLPVVRHGDGMVPCGVTDELVRDIHWGPVW